MSTVKEELTRLIQAQSDDSSREGIVRELAFHVMVERGLAYIRHRVFVFKQQVANKIQPTTKGVFP